MSTQLALDPAVAAHIAAINSLDVHRRQVRQLKIEMTVLAPGFNTFR